MNLPLNLQGHVTVVTGASRGIGAAIARAHARAGSNLVITARTESLLRDMAQDISATYHVECMPHVGDVQDEACVQELYKKVHATYGRVDHLIANAGILADRVIGMIKPDFLRHALDVNVVGVVNHLQLAARLMSKSGGGSITIISSIFGQRGGEGQAVYAASKAALIGITLSAAKELGDRQIRVNALAPGMIDTDMLRDVPDSVMKKRIESIALGRIGTTDDVADVALFLSSDLARYVTGQIIGVDGGMAI